MRSFTGKRYVASWWPQVARIPYYNKLLPLASVFQQQTRLWGYPWQSTVRLAASAEIAWNFSGSTNTQEFQSLSISHAGYLGQDGGRYGGIVDSILAPKGLCCLPTKDTIITTNSKRICWAKCPWVIGWVANSV